MTTVSIAKKDLKDALDNIIEDLDLNLKQKLMSKDDRIETKQKINVLKNLSNRFSLIKKNRYWKTTSIAWVAYKVSSKSVKVELKISYVWRKLWKQ